MFYNLLSVDVVKFCAEPCNSRCALRGFISVSYPHIYLSVDVVKFCVEPCKF